MSTKNFQSESIIQTCKFLPLRMEGLTPEIVRKGEEELHETPERRQEALKELRRLINAESDFRPLMDEQFLLRFLRSRKFDPEVAIKTLKNYYTFKVRYSRILTDFLPSEVEHVFDLNMLTVVPQRDRDGCLVGVAKLAGLDLDKVNIDELIQAIIVCAEHELKSEATQICGVVVIANLKGITLRFVRQLASPTLLYRIVRAIQDCLPIRIKAVHVIHEPFYFSIVFNILKKFLSEKIKKRFQFHGNNLSSLHKQVPPEILPQEFGGLQGPLDNTEYIKEILGTDNHFAKIVKYGYQEKRAQFIRKKSSMAFGLFL